MRFFTHEINSRNDDRVFELIDIHGLGGYGFFWVILEELYGSEDTGFQIEATNIWMKRLARSLNLTDDRTIIRYFDTLADLGLIDKQLWHERIIYSQGVMDRADAYMEKKAKEAEKKRNQRVQAKSSEACPDSVPRDTLGTESMSQNVPLSYTDPYADPHSHSQANPKTEEENARTENIYTVPPVNFPDLDLPTKEISIADMAEEKETPFPPTPLASLSPENVGLAIATTKKPQKLKKSRSKKYVDPADRELFEPFRIVWNEYSPDHWEKYADLDAVMIGKLKSFVKTLEKNESLPVFQQGLQYLRADKFYGGSRVNWTLAGYLSHDKPLEHSLNYERQQARSQQLQSNTDRPMTASDIRKAETYLKYKEALTA